VTPIVIRNMYYVMIDAVTATDVLHYASLVPATFAINYEYDINLPSPTTSLHLTVVSDQSTTGYVYVYVSSNLNFNLLYSFKKSDGAFYQYAKLTGHTSSVHSYGRFDML